MEKLKKQRIKAEIYYALIMLIPVGAVLIAQLDIVSFIVWAAITRGLFWAGKKKGLAIER